VQFRDNTTSERNLALQFNAHHLQILIGEPLCVVDERARANECAKMLERVVRCEPRMQQFGLKTTTTTTTTITGYYI
jgi:hypothetical protein